MGSPTPVVGWRANAISTGGGVALSGPEPVQSGSSKLSGVWSAGSDLACGAFGEVLR